MTATLITTPVAFMVFNRPETTSLVFQCIREARPSRLLLVADGPRPGRPGEAERCAEVRRIAGEVDWPCEASTNFSETNLGCGLRMATGIDWIFEQVEEAIILEDDCLPDPSFFRFCQELLADPALRKRLGTAGMLRVEQEFSEEAQDRKLMDLYRGLVKRGESDE